MQQTLDHVSLGDMSHLSEAQRSELHTRLRELAAQLDAELQQSSEAAKPVSLDNPIGRVSRIDAIAQQETIAAGRAVKRQRLQQARSALERIATDPDFGLCRECEEPIAWKRLHARPDAPLCLACQQQREC